MLTPVAPPLDATLVALAALTVAADSLTIGTGADAFSQVTFGANTFPAKGSGGGLAAKAISDFGLSLVDDANASAARTTLGLGTAAVQDSSAFDAAGLAAAALVTAEGYTDGAVSALSTVYQPLDSDLTAFSGLNIAADKLPYGTGSHTLGLADFTAAARTVLDDATVAAMVDTLGGAAATGTGGLVRSASPALTAIPTAPTAAALTSTTQIATCAFVTGAVATAVTGTLRFLGATDCSSNPNYPAASKGDVYVVSVAGKIGGASGTAVDVGDEYFATADNAGGTQAAVGASWATLEHNLQGALLSANNLSDVANAATARTNLGLGVGTNVQAWDADLDALAALAGTNTIYYRSAANTWSAVTIGTGLSFAGGSLALDVGIAPTWSAQHVFLVGAAGAAPLVIRQTGGVAGTNELQLSQNGSRGLIIDKQTNVGLSLGGQAGTLCIVDVSNTCLTTQALRYRIAASAVATPTAQLTGDGNGSLDMNALFKLQWGNSTAYNSTKDVALSRNAAGVIEVNTGTAGVYGGLITGVHTINPPARSGGVAPYLQVIAPADTAQTASTEAIGVQFGGTNANPPLTVTRQYATGALATHRENLFTAPTLAAAGASTITTAATVAITGAPVAGTNATITNPYALLVQTGNVGITGSNNAAGLFQITASGGVNPNFIMKGSGEQTFRFYNTASSGSTRVSWKMASRLDTDWAWLMYTDSADNGTNDFNLDSSTVGYGNHTINVTSAGLVTLANGRLALSTGTLAGTTGAVLKAAASRTAALLQLQTSAGASLGNPGGTIFDGFADAASVSTDGITEDNLYSHTLAANTLLINGDAVLQREYATFAASATATRRLRKYFAGTLIWDSGSLTMTLGGDYWLTTMVMRESATVVRVTVSVSTTGASAVPYVTHTRITGLTLSATNILKTTSLVGGTGALAGDVTEKMSKVETKMAA